MSKKAKQAAAKGRKVAEAKAAAATTAAATGAGLGDFDATPEPATKAPKAKREVKEGTLPPLPKMPSAARPRKPRPTKPCTCGCGGQTAGLWVPGHDARAKGYALRIERDIMKLSDVPANERAGAEFMLKVRKEEGATGKVKLVKGKKQEAEQADKAVNQ